MNAMRGLFVTVTSVLALGALQVCSLSCDSSPSVSPDSGTAAPSEATAKGEAAVTPSSGEGTAKPVAAASSSSKAEPSAKRSDWPMWGGTTERNMVNLHARNIPVDFDISEGKHVKWSATLGSQTYGNPVIDDGKVLVGTNNTGERNPDIKGDKGIIMCFDAETGEFLWQIVHDKLSIGRVNDWPEQGICSTPVIDSGRFYYVSNRAQVICADLEGFLDGENDGPYKNEKYTSKIDGDIIWELDMIGYLDVFPHNLATSSPVIGGDIVFVLTSNGVDEGHVDIPSVDAPSFIAVNKNTGELVWEDDAPGENILHGQWSSPAYGEIAGQAQVIFPGGDGWVYAYEPETGKQLWRFDCNPKDSRWVLGGRGTRNSLISTPVIYKDHVYIAVGQDPEHGEGPGHLYSIHPAGKSGDITESGKVWHFGNEDFGRTMSTVAIADGLLYASDLAGFFHCLDLESGKPYWTYDMLSAVWGSPMVADGKVFLGTEDGILFIFKHGKDSGEPIAEKVFPSSVYSTPTIVDDTMYISSRTHLYCIQKN